MTNKIKFIDQIHTLGDKKIFVDTNIWILLEGLNGLSAKGRQDKYSRALGYLKENKKVIVTNEYVLSELCNKSVKLEYEFAKEASGLGNSFMRYKDFRQTDEFSNALEVARDTCLNILNDCEFCSCHDKHYSIKDVLQEFSCGKMDFSDILIYKHCKCEDYVLMTDDGDYAGSDIEILTANKRLSGR